MLGTAIVCGMIGWLIGSGAGAEEKWQPDAEFPMANAHITWEQTYHAGAWGVGE